jgi:hypothetical protein
MGRGTRILAVLVHGRAELRDPCEVVGCRPELVRDRRGRRHERRRSLGGEDLVALEVIDACRIHHIRAPGAQLLR